MRVRTIFLLLLLFGAVRAQDGGDDAAAPEKDPAAKKPIALAVIVHPKNPVTKISFRELRAYLRMERQFWPNEKRCVLYLPSRKSDASDILLQKVYRMSHKQLQVYWMRKLFSGEIPAKPSYVPSSRAAGSQVLRSEGALSIVPADEIPKDVRALLIDGKKPGEEGYPLVATPRETPDGDET